MSINHSNAKVKKLREDRMKIKRKKHIQKKTQNTKGI